MSAPQPNAPRSSKPPSAPLRAAAINVDIDSLHLYYRIHGLDEASATNAVWERGVIRFAELFASLNVKATFFVVASDLERWPEAARIAAQLVADGHELGSHSLTHPYDLVRQHDRSISHELAESHRILSAVRGSPVAGFRAPGYTMTPHVLRLLKVHGYAYDSSIFPCPPYYLAKLAVLAKMAVTGKRSHSIVGPPSVMWDDRLPSLKEGLIELPVTVLPGLRLPFIGTSLLMLKQSGFRMIRPLLRKTSFINLELHGIDLCDLAADNIDKTLLKQPDLRVPLADKLALFRQVFSELRDDWGVDTLENLAPQLVSA